MTKQLEALIAEMKAAAESATGDQWVRESGEGWDAICSDDDQLNGGFIVAEFQGPEAQANRIFSQSSSPTNVLALIAALEQSQQQNKEIIDESTESTNELARIIQREIKLRRAAEKRVAELESTLELEREKSRRVMSQNHQLENSHKKLREAMAAIHNTVQIDGASASLSVIRAAARRAHEESATIAQLEASPLAVKLPTQEKYDDTLSAHEAIKDCAEAIRAAGGTVEGE